MAFSEKQRTIASDCVFEGRALQTGRKVRMICRPAEVGAGISFCRTDLEGEPELKLEEAMFSGKYNRRSTLASGRVEIQTVEHFLASLWALQIDNIMVEMDAAELPAMDGSALEFLRALKEAGVKEQEGRRETIKIDKELRIEEGDRSLVIEPAESLTVSYYIDYKAACIGQDNFNIDLDPVSFEEAIAPARTFCMKREALLLRLSGLGKGATLKNTLVLGNKGPMGTEFRFKDEPVRHKVLDLVGDMYMLGRPVIGKISARKSGHTMNARLVKKIYDQYVV